MTTTTRIIYSGMSSVTLRGIRQFYKKPLHVMDTHYSFHRWKKAKTPKQKKTKPAPKQT